MGSCAIEYECPEIVRRTQLGKPVCRIIFVTRAGLDTVEARRSRRPIAYACLTRPLLLSATHLVPLIRRDVAPTRPFGKVDAAASNAHQFTKRAGVEFRS